MSEKRHEGKGEDVSREEMQPECAELNPDRATKVGIEPNNNSGFSSLILKSGHKIDVDSFVYDYSAGEYSTTNGFSLGGHLWNEKSGDALLIKRFTDTDKIFKKHGIVAAVEVVMEDRETTKEILSDYKRRGVSQSLNEKLYLATPEMDFITVYIKEKYRAELEEFAQANSIMESLIYNFNVIGILQEGILTVEKDVRRILAKLIRSEVVTQEDIKQLQTIKEMATGGANWHKNFWENNRSAERQATANQAAAEYIDILLQYIASIQK